VAVSLDIDLRVRPRSGDGDLRVLHPYSAVEFVELLEACVDPVKIAPFGLGACSSSRRGIPRRVPLLARWGVPVPPGQYTCSDAR
jgi:hypothetical protein